MRIIYPVQDDMLSTSFFLKLTTASISQFKFDNIPFSFVQKGKTKKEDEGDDIKEHSRTTILLLI